MRQRLIRVKAYLLLIGSQAAELNPLDRYADPVCITQSNLYATIKKLIVYDKGA